MHRLGRTHFAHSALLLTASALAGCAGSRVEAPPDAALPDAALSDAGTNPVSDSGTLDPSCRPDYHLCGESCVHDQPDIPSFGCRLGCGEVCPEPDGGRVICEEGACAYRECLTCDEVGAVCGTIADGCGNQLECGTCDPSLRCEDNQCLECPDGHEPNAQATPTSLGTMADIPNSARYEGHVSLHATGDEDWYHVVIEDRGDTVFGTGGPPNITITVDGFPEGLVPALDAVFECTAGTTTANCGAGSISAGDGWCEDAVVDDSELEVYLDVDCAPNDGNDADGDLFVRVRATANPGPSICGIYELHVNVR
jgi:hypothetical protein